MGIDTKTVIIFPDRLVLLFRYDNSSAADIVVVVRLATLGQYRLQMAQQQRSVCK